MMDDDDILELVEQMFPNPCDGTDAYNHVDLWDMESEHPDFWEE